MIRTGIHNRLTAPPVVKSFAGGAALILLAALAGGSLVALGLEASSSDEAFNFDAYLLRVARFTVLQAVASSLLSVAFAIPVARALYSQARFPGRGLILRLFALPLALPALVAVLGVTSIYGRNGFIAQASQWLGYPLQPDIYGLTGILIAHIFFNMPLAARLILAAYESIPTDYWKLAAQLGMNNRARFRLIEWPVIRRNLPGMTGLIFMLCVTSFTTVLTLGGGPRATTLEVAIYQSLHFDFDPARAVALTFTQLALTLLILLALRLTGRPSEEGFTLATSVRHYSKPPTSERLFNVVVIAIGFLYVALPIAGVVVSGLAADLVRLLSERIVWRAIGTSIVLGFSAAFLSVILSLALVIAREAARSARLASFFDTGASLILVMPPIVIGAGWFILLRHFTDPFGMAPIMVVTVNAAMAMPFAVRLLRPAWDTAAARHNKLCAQLGIHGLSRLKLVDWPSIRKPFGMAFAFAMALSLGDLGTIALFGSDALQTLPYLLLQRMGSYRTFDAAGLALILGLLCLGLMMTADRAASRESKSA
ncbi:thiamine/thiamine pyrophosphate ABC transporter permease ThiP [Falsochrobactrum sp. TDYN1]|uniref:Thiamine/thiamine pyrophosphate ABC transporter permease ThiP n=1 Tax=Falsochrobactrum tianjinense TaxID=2706015 RepID=A0A949PPS5_9HYPH|nr:thiamine/thiamine pyrophosphate ABC transporter permease ThiP [Falsochrobactrum sp. TDYN1]MBV2144768.1 thiamine/thiamine pyrophosphate ABC transporter permease ThiP [Falsochrobactrum sp. TDYN1]